MELFTRTLNLRSCTRRELLPLRYWPPSFTYEAYATVMFFLFLMKALYATERGWEAWSAKKARSRWIQGDNWRGLPWGGYWQWKSHMPFLSPWILPLQVWHNLCSCFLRYCFAFGTYGNYFLWIFARIMDKHLKALAPIYVGTKFVKLDAEVCILPLGYILLSFKNPEA